VTSPAIRYLLAKRTVDDRALNRHVLDTLRAALPTDRSSPLRVLELGAGAGTMIARAIEWGLLEEAEYTAVDSDHEALAEARRSLPSWASRHGYRCDAGEDSLTITGPRCRVKVRICHEDLFAFEGDGRPYDLLIANAVLDLVDVEAALPRLWKHLSPGAPFWFTINFDGETIFLPERDHELGDHILGLYHRSMDERTPDGSHTGRHLLERLLASGAQVLAAGASDWFVHAIGGRYPAAEAEFLHFILDTIGAELEGHPELDAQRLRGWLDARRAEIDAGELAYIAHQLDYAGRAPVG
jgi:SAM-dependent methyltransferase